jgi:lysophospholipase L1-like esterase
MSQTRSRGRLLAFSLTPLLVLAATAELATRLLGLGADDAVAAGTGLTGGVLTRSDPLLGWSMNPGVRFSSPFQGGAYQITTNALGLRGAELPEKQPGEYRILSLGESTTFGLGVDDDETYSARLQELLPKRTGREVTVINAGHSAYSSTQSLIYLRERGLALEPDMILFYHEANDYMPSAMRDSENHEVGVLLTDRELFESKLHRLNRFLLSHSAVYRLLSRSYAQYRVGRFDAGDVENPIEQIGLPDIRVGVEGPEVGELLWRRVSDAERVDNFAELEAVARERGIELVVMHPSYRHSDVHECVLTRYAAANGLELFDAQPIMHSKVSSSVMYLDLWHPSPYGHRLLAEALADEIAPRIRAAQFSDSASASRP